MIRAITLLFLSSLAINISAQTVVTDLSKNWKFFHPLTSKWYKAEVPGTIHTDLLNHKLIPDPYYRDNENKVQWVEKETWKYKLNFQLTKKQLSQKHIELVFDGLDTYSEVFLNGKKILSTDNMFHDWRIDVKPFLKTSNELVVHFLPAAEIAKKKKTESAIAYPDNERVFVRKAQYQFGWDWGPRLVTCGIWKNVRIESFGAKKDEDSLHLNPWNLELVTEKDKIGEAFYFTRNGSKVYIKGTNWIPSDNFLPRAKKLKRYEQLIKAAKEANINMIRVWGGGVYEDDVFYDLCDKYGIMVWQDFMFAGSMYPADPGSLQSIEREVRYQVKRLRQHPSIALWCGNNEIEEAWFNWGWQKQHNYSSQDSLKLWNDYKKIFHELIPSIVKELDPSRSYWASSPSLGWGRDSAYLKGDVHYWGVWWGKEPVEKYFEKVGRFNSEYGMQGMPDMKTIRQFALPEDLDTTSAVMKTHQKHPFGYENIKLYIERKFRTPKSFEDLVYVSQLMQADAIKKAITIHKAYSGKVNSGTMFWQWNDCWPGVSWSAIDYYGRKKALYYEVKRSFSETALDVQYFKNMWTIFSFFDRTSNQNNNGLVSNAGLVSIAPMIPAGPDKGELRVDSYDFNDFIGISDSLLYRKGGNKKDYYLKVVLTHNTLNSRSKHVYSFLLDDPKNVNLPPAKISATITSWGIELWSDNFAYGVQITVPDGIELSDNYFNLIPGEIKVVTFDSVVDLDKIKNKIKFKSLSDTHK